MSKRERERENFLVPCYAAGLCVLWTGMASHLTKDSGVSDCVSPMTAPHCLSSITSLFCIIYLSNDASVLVFECDVSAIDIST